MNLSRLINQKEWFKDEYRRTVILRGVNLGGDCKVPYSPNEMTCYPTDFSKHKDVSFIGRPFPMEEAQEHFSRLKEWGFNVLRLLTTWEAVEHKGPGDYDTKYLDYYTKLCKMAGEYGFYVFVDFHQDVWSRMTGGDGAPCWLFEKIGIDYTKLSEVNAAFVMQHEYDFNDPRPRQEDNYPTMSWGQNYKYLGNALMWTLFFGGKDFARGFKIDGKNVQDYMLDHYLGCLKEIGKRVKDFPNVMGFDSLNEPSKGWIGRAINDRHVKGTKRNPPLPGIPWSPIDALYSSRGFSIEMPFLELSLMRGGFVPKRNILVNPNRVNLWINDEKDPFMKSGAWELNNDGNYEILKNDHFQNVDNRRVNFIEDYMTPFFDIVSKTIREINPEWLLFAEITAEEATFDPSFPKIMPPKSVNATHWYDIAISGTKRVLYPVTLDLIERKPAIGKKGIGKMYKRQLGKIKNASGNINNGCPTLIGEFGVHMDLYKGKAYKKWNKGLHDQKIWKKHIFALDLMYNAMDALFLNGTYWNYTAANRNDLRIGDGWNQEDLSIYCIDQRDNPSDINSGGRAIQGFVRPYARFIQGTPIKMSFDIKKKVFSLEYNSDPEISAPTEIYVPKIQFPSGYTLNIINKSSIQEEREGQLVKILSKEKDIVKVIITGN